MPRSVRGPRGSLDARGKAANKAPSRKRTKPLNVSKVHLERQLRRFANRTKRGMLVLDAGAGSAPYRKLFTHARYETADFAQFKGKKYAELDYVCDLTSIPVEDGRFDRVIFNQVLEHLPEPDLVLAELFRVVKPGGSVFCSVPLFYAEHGVPYDFYRFTQFGLRRMFQKAGFEVVSLRWLEGYFGTVAYQFRTMHRALPADRRAVRALGVSRRRAVTVAPTILFTRWLAGRLERFYAEADVAWKVTDSGMPKNYVVIARKPHPEANILTS